MLKKKEGDQYLGRHLNEPFDSSNTFSPPTCQPVALMNVIFLKEIPREVANLCLESLKEDARVAIETSIREWNESVRQEGPRIKDDYQKSVYELLTDGFCLYPKGMKFSRSKAKLRKNSLMQVTKELTLDRAVSK